MPSFWQSFYSYVLIPLFWFIVRIAGLFNDKVRRGIYGRKNLFASLEGVSADLPAGTRVWFHSSSMGEFEQAKPIIAELKRRFSTIRILVTFFSPSGFEHSRKYPLADLVSYIPFDSRRGARRFLDIIKPEAVVFVRYDVWPNHIWELKRRGIPMFIANATMRRTTARRIPFVRGFHRLVYNAINEIHAVSESDAEMFNRFGLTHPRIVVVGDTRYDQVHARSVEAVNRHIVPASILEGRKVIVAGSCWPEDDAVLIPAILELGDILPHLLMIHVPHEPTIDHLEELEGELAGKTSFIRFSALNEYTGERVIIVDSVGILLPLYASAHVAFIGGSFRQGIHNVLEAAVFGIPVLFGPRHNNSQEPLMLVERGGGFVVNNSRELSRTLLNLIENENARRTTGNRAAEFVRLNTGATERFLGSLLPYLNLDDATLKNLPVEAEP